MIPSESVPALLLALIVMNVWKPWIAAWLAGG
jgi:hypothetical protein